MELVKFIISTNCMSITYCFYLLNVSESYKQAVKEFIQLSPECFKMLFS